MSTHDQFGLTMSGQALTALRRYPAQTAFSWDGGTMTYRGASDLIGRMQALFVQQGLGRGQILAILSDNCAEAWCATIAAQGLGLGVTALHPKGSASDQLFQILDSDAACLVVDVEGHAARVHEVLAGLPSSILVLALGRSDFAEDLVAAADAHGTASAVDLAAPDDVALIHYTGGTTGRGKGAVRSHRSAVPFAVTGALGDLELPETPDYLAIAPHSHVAGTFLIPILRKGGSVHLMRRFDVEQAIAIIARSRINFTFFVPSMLYAILDAATGAKADFSSLQQILYGAAPMSPVRLAEALERIGPVLTQGYGQTEVFPTSILSRSDHRLDAPELFNSCGFPVASAVVKLLDDEGREVGPGESGEICVRSPTAMERYHKLPELTAETLAGGWVHSGDIGCQDERGYLYIVDRKKDMIISGGFNVYPREVEDALATHEAVAVSAVVGVADAHWGEAVTAFVVLRPGAIVATQDLIAHVKRLKGSVQAPKRVEVVDALPTTPLGKIDKRQLRSRPLPDHRPCG